MMTRPKTLAAALVTALAAGACAMSASDGPDLTTPRTATAAVEVTNNNWLDINVYALRDGTRARLGNVRSMETRTFRIPGDMVAGGGSVQLLAAPIGSTRVHRTDRILVVQGDRIQWSLENRLALSSYRVSSGPR